MGPRYQHEPMNPVHIFVPGKEWLTPERCSITELLNSPHDPTCSIARARVEPGVTTQLHALRGVTERYVLLEGSGRVEIAGVPAVEVRPLMVVHIPADAPQRITNTGTTDLVFLCICTPPFTPECYRNLE